MLSIQFLILVFIFQKVAVALFLCLLCSSAGAHITKFSSSVLPPFGLSINSHQRQRFPKVRNFQASETVEPIYLQRSPLSLASTSTDQHYQWLDTGSSPELVQSGWYGFNRFTPRSARNMGKYSNRKARAPFLLGESSQIQPLTSYKSQSTENKQYNEEFAIQEALRELQRNIHPVPQSQYGEPRIIMIEEAIDLPPGILVPVVRPEHQNTQPRHAKYRRPEKDFRRLAMENAPTPVTIKVVPLKISSVDIANALKMMPFVPIPLDFLNTEEKDNDNEEFGYDDKKSAEDESDLPRPSSHVATPPDNPLGITYAEAQRTEHYISKYQPRR